MTRVNQAYAIALQILKLRRGYIVVMYTEFGRTSETKSGKMNVTINIVPLALMTQMVDQGINSTVYIELLSEPMNFPTER